MVERNNLLNRLNRVKGRTQLVRITTATGFAIFVSLLAASQANAATFNVKTFGATGNGTTDDTTAIQNAIAAANKIPGSTVLFPTGQYLFSGTLRPRSIALLGENKQSQLISNADAAFIMIFPGESPEEPTRIDQLSFTATNVLNSAIVGVGTNWAVSNCQFSRVSVAIQANFANSQVSNGVRIHNNSVSDPQTNAFQFDHCSGMTVESNAISSTQHGDAQVAMQITNCSNLTLNSNTVACSVAMAVSTCTSLNIGGNTLSQFILAYEGQGNNSVTLSQNTFTGAGLTVPIAETNSTNVSIKANTLNNVGNGIELFLVQNAEVSGNTINNARVGVITDDGSQLEVLGNNISSCKQQGIYAVNTGGAVTLSGNTLKNCGLNAFVSGQPQAVVAANCPSASGISIDNNTYTGSINNLQFFIYSATAASAKNNKTTTTLPNHIGP